MNFLKVIGLASLIMSQTSFTQIFTEKLNCFPENDLQIPVFNSFTDEEVQTGITEEEFNEVLDEIQEIYGPVFEEAGASLRIDRLWMEKQINARALRQGNEWIIEMFGGFARHPLTTIDSFRTVACHEIGHHLGGAPKSQLNPFLRWASNEGQSDYFATYQCLKKLIIEGKAKNLNVASADLAAYEPAEYELALNKCSELFGALPDEGSTMTDEIPVEEEPIAENPSEAPLEIEVEACLRGALAGLTLGQLLSELNREEKEVSLETPNTTEVSRTNDEHPEGQCRADTYFAGSLCTLDFNSELSNEDADLGTCNTEQGFTEGIRPKCWYKRGTLGAPPRRRPPFPFPIIGSAAP